MKEEKKKIQNNFIVAAGLLALFILYTVAIMFVDVQPIGPQGSSVGFAEVNQYFHTLFGVNMLLYSITDWLSIAVLFIMFGFAMVGLVQLIKRKSLFRVDSSILVLGGFYVLVFLAYLFFEFFVVNYRPVLIEGVLEASYPSSTTMLMPQQVVKSRFLKLNSSHIEYVLEAMNKNPSDIRNIRAYLLTALYNASLTIDNYYSALVNHDFYGQDRSAGSKKPKTYDYSLCEDTL